MRLRELFRLRETRLAGMRTGIPTYVPPLLTIRGFKIIVYDTTQEKVGELGADIKNGRLSEVEFEFSDFGCGAFSFTLDSLPSFPISYRTRIDIHPYFDDTPWFSGFVQTIPKAGQKPPYRYTGFGFFEQLDWVLATGSYQAIETNLIVQDIMETFVAAPKTQIIYNAVKIGESEYSAQDINFDHVPVKDAMQQLAVIAEGYEFGVDNLREFYFRAISTDIAYHFWQGKQFQNIEIEEDPSMVRNKLYIKSGKLQTDGTNIIGEVHDDPSINAYGLREEIITAPDVLDDADALQWGGEILLDKQDPVIRATIADVLFDTTKAKIEASGKMRVTIYDGTEYELFIKQVSYSITAAGIVAQIDLES